MATVDLAVPRRALAVGAHPDDIEFGCGATLAKWSAAGCECSHLVLTDGSKGTWDPDEDVAALVATRRDEQRAAAAALGCTGEQRFGGWVDGELDESVEVRRFVVTAIRQLRPDVVLGHDPWKRYRLHPDHRHAGFVTVDAVVAARDPHFFADLGPHHRPSALLLFEADEADHVENVGGPADAEVEVAGGWAEAKVDALLAHRSQLLPTMGIADPSDQAAVDTFRREVLGRLEEHGALAGLPQGEAFRALTDL